MDVSLLVGQGVRWSGTTRMVVVLSPSVAVTLRHRWCPEPEAGAGKAKPPGTSASACLPLRAVRPSGGFVDLTVTGQPGCRQLSAAQLGRICLARSAPRSPPIVDNAVDSLEGAVDTVWTVSGRLVLVSSSWCGNLVTRLALRCLGGHRPGSGREVEVEHGAAG